MKLTLFVANSASTSSKPDDVQNHLRLSLPPKSDRVDDQNLDVFPNPDRKSCVLELQGCTDAIIAAFRGGRRVKCTFEIEE